MPELPEVETMVRGVRPHVEGRKIRRLRACECPCKPLTIRPGLEELARRVEGQTIRRVSRRAKRAILELATGEAIVIEPRMTGLLLLSDPPDVGHLRLEWQLAGQGAYSSLWFWDRRGLGTVSLYDPDTYAGLLATGQLGRDALEMTLDDWRQITASTAREIKVALLDQKLVAGIGNLYASEILHRAKIHPQLRACDLNLAQLRRLADSTQVILETAIEYEGSTLSDGTYRNALNEAGGYQNAHLVYDRATLACATCTRGTVERIVQAQRSTFFCPRCQKPPRPA